MKTIYKFLFISSIVLCSCEIDELTVFERSDSYIYFDAPYISAQKLDTMEYSFALDDIEVTNYTFKIPVKVAGFPFSVDRTFKVILDEEKSNVTDSDWDKTSIENCVIKNGIVFDTLCVVVKRNAILKTEKRIISLDLSANENFELGDTTHLRVNLQFSDILLSPDWWNPALKDGFYQYFGDFCREKFVKWQEIYYLGVDRNKDEDGNPFYWGNMPSSATERVCPITFMYMRILRDYFEENEIYPDNDRTKPRVLLKPNF